VHFDDIDEELEDIVTDEELLDALENEGNTTIKDALINEGILTVDNLAYRGEREIIFILRDYGIPGSKALEIHKQAQDLYDAACGFSSVETEEETYAWGFRFLESEEEPEILSTGCPSFDNILKGGFRTGNFYEIFEESGSGKSLLMEQMSCMSHLPVEDGGLNTPAIIYIATMNGYQSSRLKAIAKNLGIKPATITNKMTRYLPKTSDALLRFCKNQLPKIMKETGAKLAILNDLATHFRSEYGRELKRLPERQRKAKNVVRYLKGIAKKFNAVVLMSNQTVAGGEHAIGRTVGHESPTRIRIGPHEGNIKKINVEKNINLPTDPCFLEKTENGFREVKLDNS